MWKDPIVEEVRKERLKIEEECGGTFEGIAADARKVQESVKERLSDRQPVELSVLVRH